MTEKNTLPAIAAATVATLVVCIFVANLFDRPFFWWLPSSSVFLIIGVIVGLILRLSASNGDTSGDPFVTFNPNIFFNFLLPPIIFQAGLALMKKDFFQNIGTIMLLAVVGTLLSLGVVFGYLRMFQPNIAALPAGLFAVLISAVDPVAVLALFEKYSSNCDRVVYALILGESLLNDAVCVVLFDFLKTFSDSPSFGKSFGQFIYLSFVSPLVGVVFGVIVSLVFKHANLHGHVPIEVGVAIMLGAYLPYLVAELCGLSAIVTIFVCGIMVNHYTLRNMSTRTSDGLIAVSGTMAMIAEMMVFLYIGVGVLGATHIVWDFKFIFHIIFACLLSRAANTYILIPLCNLRRTKKITVPQMSAVWYAGLRGAIAFALASELADIYDDTRYVSCALAVVMFTTVVLGGFADLLYRKMKMIGISNHTIDNTEYEASHAFQALPRASTIKVPASHKHWRNLDNQYLKPFLCISHPAGDRSALVNQIAVVTSSPAAPMPSNVEDSFNVSLASQDYSRHNTLAT
eukprot:c7749_g1_i1.p1 GENE.c7749_g1_i1~~c7749_g1_i1.p1  ORF type:complete len:516 (-),score=116.72 c7749_g1_i1:123-1670(-)